MNTPDEPEDPDDLARWRALSRLPALLKLTADPSERESAEPAINLHSALKDFRDALTPERLQALADIFTPEQKRQFVEIMEYVTKIPESDRKDGA